MAARKGVRSRTKARPEERAAAGPRRRGRPPLVDKARLLDAAESAIRRYGATVSLDRIAAKAGVTKPVLFAHVGDRQALLHALSERLLTRMEAAAQAAVAAAPPSGPGPLESLIRAQLETIASDRHLYAFVNGGGAGATELASTLEFARRSAAPLIAGIADARVRAGLDPAPAEAWGHAIIGVLHMTGLWWLQKPATDRDAAQLAAQLTDLLWNGLAPRGRAQE